MGCYLGWHFPVGCPLRGGRGEYEQQGLLFHQKQLMKKNITLTWASLTQNLIALNACRGV
jgi:hypothetical protein